jgi:hypothetical protein
MEVIILIGFIYLFSYLFYDIIHHVVVLKKEINILKTCIGNLKQKIKCLNQCDNEKHDEK